MKQEKLTFKDTSFQALFSAECLERLDAAFLSSLSEADPEVHAGLMHYRQGELTEPKAVSALLIRVGEVLDTFLIDYFDIELLAMKLQAEIRVSDPVFAFKAFFVQRQAKRALHKKDETYDFKDLNQWVNAQVAEIGLTDEDLELSVAKLGQYYLNEPEVHAEAIQQLTDWCVAALTTPEGQAVVRHWVSFKLPAKLDYQQLVAIEPVPNDEVERLQGPPESWRQREGFKLTDPRMSEREVQNEIHYCVYCHKTDGDFCSKGFPLKKKEPEQGLKVNPLGETLTGCPLEEKISEMHVLKKDGYSLGALAMIMADNPMCPATGHRICNDCMKACIYQKQEPVDIPQTETRILTDVLGLPWGVEIYDLLTRWNPLRANQHTLKPHNGLKVLIMGMGPAGFTMAHHLTMEGFTVVGAEGLKVEPLPREWLEQPIEDYESLVESLDDRFMAGFGGVAEYGITVRWDKNFLKLIYISLMRRQNFQVIGSIRFGGTLTVERAWELGFDHLVLAVGAGLPRELLIPGSLAPGMRQANDFLMALQLTGAAKKSSLANLQVRLPAVVIGGGLTGIDTATEVQAYYLTQIEKARTRYETLCEHYGEAAVRERFSAHDLEVLDEFIAHAKEYEAEQKRAALDAREPDVIRLLRSWGGVTVAYRRTMQESPAYKRNHEEVAKALEEGIYYAEGLQPASVVLDKAGYVSALKCKARVLDEEGNWILSDQIDTLPARAIFVATGAKPNIAYEFEHRGTFLRDGFEYERFDLEDNTLKRVETRGDVKMPDFGPFTSYQRDHRFVSFIGDTHPVFHGSVVKAIASAKRTYPKIVEALKEKVKVKPHHSCMDFFEHVRSEFRARVVSVERLTQDTVQLTVRAPLAAKSFQPGQFYRLQNYERKTPIVGGTRLQTEALAMNAIHRPEQPDYLSFIVKERGVSSRLVATFKPGIRIALMGPTGAKMRMPDEPSNLLIIGGAMAAAHVLSAGATLKAAGHRLLYLATFPNEDAVFLREELIQAADDILWVCGEQDPFQALSDHLKAPGSAFKIKEIQDIILISSSDTLRAFQAARSGVLEDAFDPGARFSASVYGPMQCMLKGVCAQCLQWQIDPKTGKRTKAVYACSWQTQPLEIIDIGNIDERLAQNRMQEHLSDLWLDYVFDTHHLERV